MTIGGNHSKDDMSHYIGKASQVINPNVTACQNTCRISDSRGFQGFFRAFPGPDFLCMRHGALGSPTASPKVPKREARGTQNNPLLVDALIPLECRGLTMLEPSERLGCI